VKIAKWAVVLSPFAVAIAIAAPASAAPPPNYQCAANGALIAVAAQSPGPNTGLYLVAPGDPNNPGQSIQYVGKSGACHVP
jgi:hypothetical protein